MTLYDDLLVDDVSLSVGLPEDVAVGACLDGPWVFPFLSADQRGDFPVYLGYDGAGYTDQPYATWIMPVYLTLSAPPCVDDLPAQSDDEWDWINNAIEQVRLLCRPDQQVILTKRRSMPDGDDELTARAKLVRITPSRDGRDTLRLVIEWLMIDPLWYAEDVVEALTGSSTIITVPGTGRTHDMILHVTGTNARVVNNTNGYEFTLNTTTPGGGAYVDVLARTAGSAPGGTELSRYLAWPKSHLMRLDPGANDMGETSTGSPTITYRPAYL